MQLFHALGGEINHDLQAITEDEARKHFKNLLPLPISELNTLSTYYKSKNMYLKESVKRALRAYTEATRVASNPQEIETDKEAKDSFRLVSLVLGLPEPENIFGPIDDGTVSE